MYYNKEKKMNNIYDLLVISIKNIEVECHKHKNKEEYL